MQLADFTFGERVQSDICETKALEQPSNGLRGTPIWKNKMRLWSGVVHGQICYFMSTLQTLSIIFYYATFGCRRPIKMSLLCHLQMTLPWGFPGGVRGDDTADERWGAFAAGGAAGFGSAAADDRGGGPALGA